jgi:hypothetical protein
VGFWIFGALLGGVARNLSVEGRKRATQEPSPLAERHRSAAWRSDELGVEPVLLSYLRRFCRYGDISADFPNGDVRSDAAGCGLSNGRFRGSGNSDEACRRIAGRSHRWADYSAVGVSGHRCDGGLPGLSIECPRSQLARWEWRLR